VTSVARLTPAVGTKPIFISYRRADTSGYAGRLQDDLAERFGDDLIFRDVVKIQPGKDYVDVIDGALESCSAMLVVIGREWLDYRDEEGRRRLDDPTDVLRLEVAAALRRDTVVIPVLVEKATMPAADDLPEPMRDLARRQAIELSDINWDHDVARLVAAISASTGTPAHAAPGEPRARRVPKRPLIAAGGAVALLFVLVAVRAVTRDDSPPPMTGRLNIAVAEFSELDARGRIVTSSTSTQLSKGFDRLVSQEVRSVEGGQEVQHRLIGRLDGPDPERRAAAAARAGREIAADVVVYGVLQSDSTGAILTPELYFTDRLLFDAPEIAGSHQLGTPLRSPGDARRVAVQDELLQQLGARIQVLAEMTAALRFYSVEDYASASDHLAAAERLPGWPPAEGKEVLYLLLGNVSGRLGRLADAERWYDRAREVQADDSRASLGKAEVAYHAARGDCEQGHVDADGLRRSLAAYATARAGRQPAGADVPVKVTFGEGRVLLCLSQALVEDSWREATARFQQVVDAYGGKDSLLELAAEAHGNLGFLYRPFAPDDPGGRDGYLRAAGELQAAIKLYEGARVHGERQAFFYAELGYVEARLGDAKKAAEAFRVAIDRAPDQPTKDRYRQVQRDVTGGTP
jgi:tetratricopeptide (TPR) repeat protein